MSASAPAGRANRTTGKLPNVSTSATSTGEVVNEVINHDSPTSCIHVPMFDTTVAIQSARNTDSRSGLQADKRLPASFPLGSLAKGIVLADFDILLDYIPKTYTVTAKCLVGLVIRKQPSRCGSTRSLRIVRIWHRNPPEVIAFFLNMSDARKIRCALEFSACHRKLIHSVAVLGAAQSFKVGTKVNR